MGVHSTLTTSLGVALLAGALAVACGGDDDAGIVEPTATPSPSIIVRTATPAATATPEPTSEPATPTTSSGPTVSLQWLDSSADVPALPDPFATPVPDAELQDAIESALPGFSGHYSVVVHNLVDGRYAAYDESRVYYSASLFKASLLYEAYRERDLGEIDFSMEVELTEEYADYDLGTLDYLELEVGDMITIEDAIRAMTIVSDTPTAVLIQDIIGVQADQTLLNLGLQETQFLNSQLPTSARDMARLIEAIASGEGVTNESRLEMLGLMRQEFYSEGVIAAAPPGTAIAHKTGSFANAAHDAAVVWGPAGPYVIVVMTDASYDFTYVHDVAKVVYDYFGANP